MTRDDIIRMAREAGLVPVNHYYVTDVFLERFAALVAERDTALLRQVLEALIYASDITDPLSEDCKCPICESIEALEDRLGETK